MPLWGDGQLETLTSCLEQSRAGRPTLLIIDGHAGTGKTTLLAELTAQAEDFRLVAADGVEGDRFPFSILTQWGVQLPAAAAAMEPFVAAQALREHLDGLATQGPVLLLLEDLHWADPESVESLIWLLRRASGDRLLVAVSTRPLGAELHSGFQRWAAGRDYARGITLAGLSEADALTLIAEQRPEMTEDAGLRVWRHTSGNPLYLTALLAEHDADELTRMRVLPAPTQFAQLLAGRISRLPAPSVDLLRAVAVLGTGWIPLPAAASVGEVEASADSAQLLCDDGLLLSRAPDGLTMIRAVHALVAAAVYQQMPLPLRRSLHTRAAAVVNQQAAVLEHRMAASEQYDDELAQAMEDYARSLFAQRSFRLAAQYLRWASALTPTPQLRQRRWLGSLLDLVLAHDYAPVHAVEADVQRSEDAVSAALVLGLLAVFERRLADGIAILEPASRLLTAEVDPLAAYRIEVLLAWARLGAGHPTALIFDGLERAAGYGISDLGVGGLALVTGAQIEVRRNGVAGVLARLESLPAHAPAVSMEATNLLAYRGSVRTALGLFAEATADLTEATRRIQDGVTDFGAGSFHAWLAFGLWMRGDWSRARLNFRLAFDVAGPFTHPMVLALAPVVDLGEGRFDEADDVLERAGERLAGAPWPEACLLLLTTRVIDVHLRGSRAEQAGLLTALRGTVLDPAGLPPPGPVGLMHVALAAIWAQEIGYAEQLVARLQEVRPQAPWIPAAVRWLEGLVAEAKGRGPEALRHLTAAIRHPELDLPLYRAHMLADQARLCLLLGEVRAADESLAGAEELYRSLGARPYVERTAALRVSRKTSGPAADSGPAFELTDRERDVLTLLVAGMSYAQIARDLFITQRTVGYHLSNIYGKAGVNSRHLLIEQVRRDPLRFGVVAAA